MLSRLKKTYNSLSLQVKASAWFLVCSLLQKGISVLTTPIFTRLLTTEEYGQYTTFNSWLSILTVIITLDLYFGVYAMGIVKFKEEARVFSSSLQGLTLILCSGWTIVYLAFRTFWNGIFGLTTFQMLCMLAMIWATAAFNFWMTEQRNEYRYRALVAVTLVVSVLKPLLGIIGVLNFDDKVSARIAGLAIAELAGYSWCFFVQMKRGGAFFSKKFWKYALCFNIPLIPHYLSTSVLSGADRIMIQNMVGASEAGIYGLAYSISQIMLLANEALNKTMSPFLYQRMKDRNYKRIPGVVYSSLAVIAAANLILIAFAPEAVAVFAPEEYYAAIYIIPPVAMSVYMQYLYQCFAPFEFYYEKKIWTTIGTLTAAGANIVLNLIFIPLFGYAAAGYTTLACYSINALMHWHFYKKVCRENCGQDQIYSPKVMLGITAAFLALGFAYLVLYGNMILRYAFTVLLLIAVFSQREKIMPKVKSLLKRG